MLDPLKNAALGATISASVGIIYARAYELNPTLVAKAFVIKNIYNHIVMNIPHYPHIKGSVKLTYAAISIANIAGNVASIVAYRHLNIIAVRGTIVFSTLAVIHSIRNLHQAHQLNIFNTL